MRRTRAAVRALALLARTAGPLVAAAVVASGAAGCSARAPDAREAAPIETLRIADEDFDREPRTVTAGEALADLDRALYVFDQAYAGLDGLPRLPEKARIDAARAAIRAALGWAPADFARLLVETFRVPDGHLSFGYGGRVPLALLAWPRRDPHLSEPLLDRIDAAGSAWLGPLELVGCAIEGDRGGERLVADASGRYRIGVFATGGARAVAAGPTGTASFMPESVPLRCAARAPDRREPEILTVPLAPAARSHAPRGGRPVELTDDGDVAVLAIRTFDGAAEAELRALPALAERLRRRGSFVVDLRGNAGGNYALAEPFVLGLTNARLLPLGEREVVSVAAAEGRANAVRRRLVAGTVPPAAMPRFEAQLALLEATAERLREQRSPRTEVVAERHPLAGRAPGPLAGRAVFLVDGGCASACEMMLALARQIPGVIVAGQNTRGGMSVGEIALFRLPRSGITLSLGTRAFRDPLGDFSETRGFVPDVWIDTPDALDKAKRLARATFPDGRTAARLPRIRRLDALASAVR